MQVISTSILKLTPDMMATRVQRPFVERPRSKGIHVQAVNKQLGIAAGKLTSDEDDDFPFERFSQTVYPLMPALGVAWEEFRASFYALDELLWQPCEFERDGIFGTPDGFVLSKYDPLWECKQTTKKIQCVTKCWMYMKQGLSYCAMSERTHVLYDVNWLLGDYMRPYSPVSTSTLVEFTTQEIETWWKIVRAAAKTVKPE